MLEMRMSLSWCRWVVLEMNRGCEDGLIEIYEIHAL